MLLPSSRMLCCGVAQNTHSPLACSCCLSSLAARAGTHFKTYYPRDSRACVIKGGRAGTQGRSQKASLDLSRRDWLGALTPPHRLVLQQDESTMANHELVEGPIMTEGLVDPSAFVFGVDPDVSGAMAVLRGDGIAVAEVFDVPTIRVMVGSRYRRRHDPGSIVSMLKELNVPAGSVAYIEQNSPLPKDGKQGWWGSGFGYGIWIGTLVASGISVVPVVSLAWKRAMGLSGKAVTKDDCRACASLMFPSLAPQLSRKKDHGRAEALLIAAYGKGIPVPPKPVLDDSTNTTQDTL